MAYQDLFNYKGSISDDQIKSVLNDNTLSERQKYDLAVKHNVVGRTGGLLGWNNQQTQSKVKQFEMQPAFGGGANKSTGIGTPGYNVRNAGASRDLSPYKGALSSGVSDDKIRQGIDAYNRGELTIGDLASLSAQFGITPDQISKATGVSREDIANAALGYVQTKPQGLQAPQYRKLAEAIMPAVRPSWMPDGASGGVNSWRGGGLLSQHVNGTIGGDQALNIAQNEFGRNIRPINGGTQLEEQVGPNQWQPIEGQAYQGGIDPATGMPTYTSRPAYLPQGGGSPTSGQGNVQSLVANTQFGTPTPMGQGGPGSEGLLRSFNESKQRFAGTQTGAPTSLNPQAQQQAQQGQQISDDQIRAVINSGQYSIPEIIDLANKNGISADRVDKAMGWQAGTANQYVAQQGGQQQQSGSGLYEQLLNWNGDPSTITNKDISAAIQSGQLTIPQIIQLANKYGLSPDRVDAAMGWQPGTSESYVLGITGKPWGPPPSEDRSLSGDENVANQLANILSENSPFLQQAGTAALQAMNARGLLTSSMADTAFANAYIQNSLPIAQQNAGQAFARGERIGGQEFEYNMSNLEFAQTRALNEQQFAQAKGLLEAEYGQRMALLQTELGSRIDLQKLQNSGAMDLEKLRTNADQWRLGQNTYLAYVNSMMQAGSAMLAETQAIQNTQGLTAEQKQTALQSVTNQYNDAFSFINKLFSSSGGWDWSFLPWAG